MTSPKTSLRNIGWRRHTPKISLQKSDIIPERLYHSRPRFSKKLMVSVGVSWSGKIDVFFIDPQKTKVDQKIFNVTLICWRLPYCLNVVDFTRQWLCVHARQHHAKVTQQFLRQNTREFIAADEWAPYSQDLNPLDYCIWDILQDLVY